MTNNDIFDNDAGRIGARMMEETRKSRNRNVLTKEKIKQTVEDFLADHEEKELTVTVYLDSDSKKSICNFHIDAQEREIVEDSTKTELIISNYASSLLSLIPDDVTIRYEEVLKYNHSVKTSETKDDILADVLEITFKNGTVLELGFLNM